MALSLNLFRSFGAVRSLYAVPARQFQSSASLWDRKSGQVKWFDRSKGFGFITPSDGTAEIFVHFSGIQSNGYKTLRDGENVEYELEEYSGKIRATKVTGPGGADVVGQTPAPSQFQQRRPRENQGNFQQRYDRQPRQDRQERSDDNQ